MARPLAGNDSRARRAHPTTAKRRPRRPPGLQLAGGEQPSEPRGHGRRARRYDPCEPAPQSPPPRPDPVAAAVDRVALALSDGPPERIQPRRAARRPRNGPGGAVVGATTARPRRRNPTTPRTPLTP